ncbi:MAG TPA: serine/threonine-protein kinase [Thermoanaerobaculia bacterium]|nr:serine/threonine-protein kinase [Thermoanaerobaculia bacterium]
MSRLEIGSHVEGKYQVLARLRGGGMGEVYRVRHIHLNETRIIKLQRAGLEAQSDAAERFHREARLATQVKHPRVATLHDYSRLSDGSFYMVWEFIEGQDVESWLREKGVFPISIALELGIQALSGLEAIHRAGIVHRDLSPDNLMITSDRRGRLGVKIIDLGLAKDTEDPGLFESQDKGFGGKLNYCSPEHVGLIEGVRPDRLSDLFSFAIVLYKMVSGRLPFDEIGPGVSLASRFEQDPYPLAERNPDVTVPPRLDDILRKALSFRREDRYPAASSFREELQAIHELGRPPRGSGAGSENAPVAGETSVVIEELKRRVEHAETQKRRFQSMQARELVEQYLATGHQALARLSLDTLVELDPEHPERFSLEERILLLSQEKEKRDSLDLVERDIEAAVERGDFEAARAAAATVQARDLRLAERLRRRVEVAEQHRQLDDQITFHRDRLDQFLDRKQLAEAELELGLLEALDMPRVVVDLYRRRIGSLGGELDRRRLRGELETRLRAELDRGVFHEARETLVELEELGADPAQVLALRQEIEQREQRAQRGAAIVEGAQAMRAFLAAGQFDHAELALRVLERMAPDDPETAALGAELRARRTPPNL